METIHEKICTRCHVRKDLKSFPTSNAAPDGKRAQCQSCESEKYRMYYAKNAEKLRAKHKQWRQKNPTKVHDYNVNYYLVNCESEKARSQAWIHKNPQKRKRIGQRRYANNPQERQSENRIWFKAHPEKKYEYNGQRRAQKAAAPLNDLTSAQWEEIKAAYGYRCYYCGRKLQKLTQDHIIPLSKGGSHTASNIVPSCRSCNSRKNNGPPPIAIQPLLFLIAPPKKKKHG